MSTNAIHAIVQTVFLALLLLLSGVMIASFPTEAIWKAMALTSFGFSAGDLCCQLRRRMRKARKARRAAAHQSDESKEKHGC
jgi:hypothetical protein